MVVSFVSTLYPQCWIRTYDGPAHHRDYANKIAIDRFDNIFITGYSKGIYNEDTSFDYCTIKYNSNGIEQWVNRYNGNTNTDDFPMAITCDSGGNYYVTGLIDNIQWVDSDIGTIKYDSNGNVSWIARYSSSSEDWGSDVVTDRLGNVYVTGYTHSDSNYLHQAITVKYNPQGIQEWVVIEPFASWTVSIGLDSFNNVYVAGQGTGHYIIIKYSSNGIRQWYASTNIAGSIYKMEVTSSGNIYVTGSSGLTGQDNWNIVTAKYNTFGQEQWVRNYDGPGGGYDIGQSLSLDRQGNVYVTGPVATQPGPVVYYYDYGTIKYTNDGNLEWVRFYEGFGSDDWPFDVVVDNQQNVYVGGYSAGPTGGGRWSDDILIIKYDSIGNTLWTNRYQGVDSLGDWVYDLALDSQDNLYACGFTWTRIQDADYIILKYSPNGGIEEKIITNKKNLLIKIYPNPFRDKVKICFPRTLLYSMDIKIYKIDGRLVKTFDKVTRSDVLWDGKDYASNLLPSGVYFVEFTFKSNRQVERLVIIK